MGIFTDRYSRPLPDWVCDIKEEVTSKVKSSIASQACREGNIPALRQLFISFWPFVDEFPKTIRRGCVKFIKHKLITDPGNADDLLSLLVLADKTLTLIERDEEEHRELWIKAAEAVGLDMVAAGWRPTVDNYLSRVTKPRILEAVREAKGDHAAQLLDHLKKGDMAQEAERLLDSTGWLPEPLRLTDGVPSSDLPAGVVETLPAFLTDGEDAQCQQAPE